MDLHSNSREGTGSRRETLGYVCSAPRVLGLNFDSNELCDPEPALSLSFPLCPGNWGHEVSSGGLGGVEGSQALLWLSTQDPPGQASPSSSPAWPRDGGPRAGGGPVQGGPELENRQGWSSLCRCHLHPATWRLFGMLTATLGP